MANTPSAKKRVRITLRRTAINKIRKSKIRTAIRKVKLALKDNETEKLPTLLRAAESVIDKAVHTRILHKNNAARKKGRLTKAVMARLV